MLLVNIILLNGLARASGELANALIDPGVAYVIAQPPASNVAPSAREEQPVAVRSFAENAPQGKLDDQ